MRVYPRRSSALANWSRRLGLFGIAVVLAGVVVARWGIFPAHQGLIVVGAGVAVSALALLLAVAAYVDIWQSGASGLTRANVGLLLALANLVLPAYQIAQAFRLPPINDVSTDPLDVPAFSRSRAALEARGGRVPEIPGEDARARQKRAYPDLEPVILELTPEETFELALEVAAALKWQIIDRAPPSARTGAGRIDATARTSVMRFTDDITIRIRPQANQTRVDIRSASRFGTHDLGANAARIRAFTAALNEAGKS